MTLKVPRAAWRALPLVLLAALYWPAVTAWFFQDDFGWLNLHREVGQAGHVAAALFAPKAHGNMRPLGENAYWLVLPSVFGAEALPLHLAALLTACASLWLLGAVARRLTKSEPAGLAAQILWIANVGVAESLGWSSIYNQVLSGFFFLLAFYFLLRYAESGRPRDRAWQWAAFVLGLGALEINVTYPALAAVYALFYARPLLKKIAPMFVVSAAVVALHFHFAPTAATGAYAPVVDGRIFASAWRYWAWTLGPMPWWGTVALTAAIGPAAWAGARRGRYGAILGLAWFAIPLLPYLVLPEHRMDYYVTVPGIGVALMGAWAIAEVRERGAVWKAVTAIAVVAYLGVGVPKGWATARWEHARGERMESLALGVEEVRARWPGKAILLEGIETDFFWSGMADLPFRGLGIAHVYLAPSEFAVIQAPHETLSKYILPAALARRRLADGSARLYRFDGRVLHRETNAPMDNEDEPRFVNIADDAFSEYLGAGWRDDLRGVKAMDGSATARIGGPRSAAERLYIGVFETHNFGLRVWANGVELPVERDFRNGDLTEFRSAIPAEGWKTMEVRLESDRRPLLFGYLEVR